MTRTFSALVLTTLLSASAVHADISGQTSGTAETGFSFLKISTSAASGAMGEAGAALYTDPFSSLHNPALIPADDRAVFTATNNDWIVDSRQVSLASGFSVSRFRLTLGVSVLDVDDFELREIAVPEPQGTFSLQDVVATLAVGTTLTTNSTMGISISRLHEKIFVDDSSGWAFGAGLNWKKGPFAASALIKNLGAVDDLGGESVDLPLLTSVGGSWQGKLPRLKTPVRLAADLLSYKSDDAHLHMGIEARPLAALRLRAGYMSGYEDRSFSWGFALRWRTLGLDYANLPFKDDFDDTHKFTFSFFM